MTVTVLDSGGATLDDALPTLPAALDPCTMQKLFAAGFDRLEDGRPLELTSIEVLRHKPRRRCLIAYTVRAEDGAEIGVLGKIRAGRSPGPDYRLLRAFSDGGFEASAPDRIRVPKPIAQIPDLGMWLQRRIPGETLTDLLEPGLKSLPRRAARAAFKIHRAGVPTRRVHRMDDELDILRGRFAELAVLRPRLEFRLGSVLARCHQIGVALPETTTCGIHRDFYADQLIMERGRTWVVDLDLYCLGDRGLDIGNFSAHLTEHALRTTGDPAALESLERSFQREYLKLAGEGVGPSIQVYKTLTLARHIYLSTQIPGRSHTTTDLLELCERRVAKGAPVGAIG